MLGCGYVEKIHDELVAKLWPGTDPVGAGEPRDLRLLDSAVNRPFQTGFGQEIYSSPIEKAAALFHSLVSNHSFYNGNKRTSVIALDHFLLANGRILIVSNKVILEAAKQTANYRQRGVSHERSLRDIVTLLDVQTITLVALREAKKKHPTLIEPYEMSMRMRKYVRRHPLNKLIP
jgi:death-on-curing family protein